MDDATEKVLAETWWDDEEYGYPDLVIHESEGDDITTERFAKFEHMGPNAEARARVAACAPEALKLLLDAERQSGGDYDDYCRWCQQDETTDYTLPDCRSEIIHTDDCPWFVLMEKAGLR